MTMHEIAKLIGVSPMTVSRVLSGNSNVRAETRETVQAAIEQFGYAPNPAARSLAAATTVRIAVLYSNPSAAYLNELLIGILKESSRSGCQIVLEECGPRGTRAAIEKMLGEGLSGILLPPPLSDSKLAHDMLRNANIPFVCIAGFPAAGEGLSVCIDNFEAAAAMTRYLLSLGHRDIAFIRGAPNQLASARRYEGFLAALQAAGVKIGPDHVKQGAFTYRSGLIAADQLLSQPNRPSAIFASNDDMAAAAIATAHRLELKVPQDLTVVGFDDTPLATTIWPSLTTVRQPVAAMARRAVELLLNEIHAPDLGRSLEQRQELLKFSLVKRASSAKPASSTGIGHSFPGTSTS
jgi:LacI family transcriptional regulator